jgi:ssDNA-binding Zn-finger/Zn-ribbon topoisomerase 1
MSKEKNKFINELKSETKKDNLPEFCKACGAKIIHKQN